MQENNTSFEIIYGDKRLPSNDIGNVGDIYLQKIFDDEGDDMYIFYANKLQRANKLIGLLIVLNIFLIGFIVLK